MGAVLSSLVEAVEQSVARAGLSMADVERLVAQDEDATKYRRAELETRHEQRVQAIHRKWQRY